jgi:thioredoxin 1
MAEGLLKINDDNFAQEVEQYQGTVLVDFSASWCPPCKMLAPIIKEVAGEVADRAKVGALDVDESRDTATRFSVLNVPTMIFFKDGKEAARIVGVTQKQKIIEQIDGL